HTHRQYSKIRTAAAAGAPATRSEKLSAETESLPGLRWRVEIARRRCLGNPGVHTGALQGDPAAASETGLRMLRTHRASPGAEPSDRTRRCGAGAVGARAGLEILRPLAVVSAIGDLRARRRGTGTLHAGGLGGRHERVAVAAGGSAAASHHGRSEAARRRHAGAGAGAGQRQNKNRAVVDLRSR